MESKISDSVLGATEVRRSPADEVQTGDRKKRAEESYGNKKVFSDTGKKISDNVLMSYSKAKLRQLYANKEITKQSYDRIMSRKK